MVAEDGKAEANRHERRGAEPSAHMTLQCYATEPYAEYPPRLLGGETAREGHEERRG